jgi:PleD family two-component response regulator
LEIVQMKYPEMDDKSITISVGLKSYNQGEGKEKLFKDADRFLYTSKSTGKNKITWQ